MDVIIINSEIEEYAETIKKEIDNELYRIYSLNSFYHTPGTVYVLEQNDISKEEMILLQVVARLYFDVEKEDSLKDEILKLEENNRINDYKKVETLHKDRFIEMKIRILLNMIIPMEDFKKKVGSILFISQIHQLHGPILLLMKNLEP